MTEHTSNFSSRQSVETEFEVASVIYRSQRTQVIKARRKSDGLPVILKTFENPNLREDSNAFGAELYITKFIDSPYIRKALSVETYNHRPALILSDPNLNSLADIIPAQGLDPKNLVNVAIELATAIKDIHDHKVIHRDINPSNILISEDLSQIKLIDFEHATRVEERQLEFEPISQLKGTLHYMAPEQTGRINRSIDYRADLYSLGATLYELATGTTPFKNTTPAELIYAQIAVDAPSILIKRPDYPASLALVIAKLLKKEANRRYQDINTLNKDLALISDALQAGVSLKDFSPSDGEHNIKVLQSTKIFGRKLEKTQLMDCFEKSKDNNQFVTISGSEGIGKTALISELYSLISASQGFFIKGKFDQYSNGQSHTAFSSAFKDLINQCLDDSDVNWKQHLDASLGKDGSLISKMIPEFSILISESSIPQTISQIELTARLNLALIETLRTICKQGRALVLFIDDLQWSDSASTQLIKNIVDANIPGLFLISSYRTTEIKDNIETMEMLDQVQASTRSIFLAPLTIEDIKDWTKEIVGNDQELIDVLSQQLYLRTQGNPFHTKILLAYIVDNNILTMQKNNTPTLNIDQLRKVPIGSIYQHLKSEIDDLEADTKEFIKKISILGNKFHIPEVELLWNSSSFIFQKHIKTLVEKGLLTKFGETLCFSHDTVQQSANELLGESRKKELHLELGRKITTDIKENKRRKNINDYIHHLNFSKDLIKEPIEKLTLASDNYDNSLELFSTGAYKLAKEALEFSLYFLPEGHESTQAILSCKVQTKLGEVQLILGNLDDGERVLNQALEISNSKQEKSQILQCLLLHYLNSYQNSLIRPTLRKLAKCLDLDIPKRPSKTSDALLYYKSRINGKQQTPEAIAKMPLGTSVDNSSYSTAITSCILVAYYAAPEYYPSIILKGLEKIFESGLNDASPQVLISYAVISMTYNNYELSNRYGKLALDLSQSLDSKSNSSFVTITYGALVHYWHHSFKSSEKYIEKGIKLAEEAGEFDTADLSINVLTFRKFFSGTNLNRLIFEQKSNIKRVESQQKQTPIDYCNYLTQLFICLTDPDGDGYTINGKYADEDKLNIQWQEDNCIFQRGNYLVDKVIICCIAGEYEKSIQNFLASQEPMKLRYGSCSAEFSKFYAAISYLAIYKKSGGLSNWVKAKRLILEIKRLTKTAPHNFIGKYTLLCAELFSIKGKHLEAMQAYEKSIELFGQTDFTHEKGFSLELFGRYLLSRKLNKYGLSCISESVKFFQHWGALAKVKHLTDEFSISGHNQHSKLSNSSTSNLSIGSELDLQALAKSIELLSGSLDTAELLKGLLLAVMTNSGATQAVYLNVEQYKLAIMAYHDGTRENVYLHDDGPNISQLDLPDHIHTWHNDKKYIYKIENIHRTEGGKYIKGGLSNTSTLLIPCLRNGVLSGVIYLENNLLLDAFREEKIQILSLLANQAAIALENSNAVSILNIEKLFSAGIINSAPIMIFGIDANGTISFSNPYSAQVTGYSEKELLGNNWYDTFAPNFSNSDRKDATRKIIQKQLVNLEHAITTSDGDTRNIIWTSFLKSNSSKSDEVITFGTDITVQKAALEKISNFNNELQEKIDQKTNNLNNTIEDLKSTQDKLVESEKMAALGGLVAGVAHEINTPIGIAITGTTQSFEISKNIAREYESGKMSQESLEKYFQQNQELSDITYKNLSRAADLIKSFKQISVDQSSEKRRNFEFVAYIKEVLTSIGSQYEAKRITIDVKYDKEFTIDSYPGLYSQILTNLVMNSLTHAYDSTSKGIIEIEIKNNDNFLLLTYKDDGKGIAPQHIGKIFDPFYTTNNHGGGTGLGLNIIYNMIVQHLNGTIECSSTLGRGATFSNKVPIILPE